jgi:hypothetical protein
MKLIVLFFALLTCACSAHPKRVDCGAHLTAINTPAPVVRPTTLPERTPAKEGGR